ncbi:MAG: hypothetical protein AB1589_22840 [Cyanobacteriota bacterium]
MSNLTLKDLQRLAIAKHGEDEAWAEAYFLGNARHKKTWQKVLDKPAKTVEEQLSNHLWQQELRKKFNL